MSAAHTAAVLGRRACAVLAATSAVLHALLLGHAANPVTGIVMVAMIAACLYCAYDLWVCGTLRAWLIVALMNLAMVALHTPGPGHHHGAAAPATTGALMGAATALAGIEVLCAATVLLYRTRDRVVSGTPVR